MSFKSFFETATKGEQPFPYQERFATAGEIFELVHAPTGAGKTATAILGWLWRRRFADKQTRASTPRRLVYCLPMRVLVEQTREVANAWLANLSLQEEIQVHVVMGGEESGQWELNPESDAIVLGTQDMLLSRALNRGYGMRRFRWPMHFGLLHNDCLWILDEIQLMGVGLATSAQLQAFRQRFGSYGKSQTVWMSATLLPAWLETVDFRGKVNNLHILKLNEEDYDAPALKERWQAAKRLEQSPVSADHPGSLADFIKGRHIRGTVTLVVVNTVERSRAVFDAIRKNLGHHKFKANRRNRTEQGAAFPDQAPDIRLIHSRFRPLERQSWMEWLYAPPPAQGRIIVSTQVIEAGVDISARTLFTELAAWPSLVQRFGRCNRKGEFTKDQPAHIYWIDVPAEDDQKASPYTKKELDEARRQLMKLANAGPKTLHALFEELSAPERADLYPYEPQHILRRKDFLDLFDTTPDLAGNDIDVARFIRDGNDLDVLVFWRGHEPSPEGTRAEGERQAPLRDELCPVPIGSFRTFLKKKKKAYRWDQLAGQWKPADADHLYPGQLFWVQTTEGGYSRDLGWDAEAVWDPALPLPQPDLERPPPTEGWDYDSDGLSVLAWRSIAKHTEEVVEEMGCILEGLCDLSLPFAALYTAARWHDWGKAHPIFQQAVKDEPQGTWKRPGQWAGRRDIAKAAPEGFWTKYCRPHFRHELASALGVLTLLRKGMPPGEWAEHPQQLQDLALYLIAAHHGKVRLSIRSMPAEAKPEGKLFARGIWEDDCLPPGINLGGGVTAPGTVLDLSPMQLGSGDDGFANWVERMIRLRDHGDFGPLRLAYLEALIRAADVRASKKAQQNGEVGHATTAT